MEVYDIINIPLHLIHDKIHLCHYIIIILFASDACGKNILFGDHKFDRFPVLNDHYY